MPYKSTDQLPKKQTDQYSEHQKSAFRKAFNSCYDAARPESTCFKIAHGAAKGAPRKKTD
jgi:cation transport regulator ChaB